MSIQDSTLPLLPGWLNQKLQQWIDRRHQQGLETFTSSRRNIYILPSKAGIFYLFVIFIILIGAINYNNSLAYLLCFFLISLGFVSMLQTYQNLLGIKLSFHRAEPTFKSSNIHYQIHITNQDNRSHIAIHAQSAHNTESFSLLPGDEIQTIEIIEPASQRGYQSISTFKLYSVFPLGLFHAWCQIRLAASAVVYPAPVNKPVELEHASLNAERGQSRKQGDEDFAGIREAQRSDSPKILAWKKIAQTGILYSKQFEAEYGESRMFDIDELKQFTSLEEKLSVLCQLLLDAEKNGLNFGLKLGTQQIELNTGPQHLHYCLKALALYQ